MATAKLWGKRWVVSCRNESEAREVMSNHERCKTKVIDIHGDMDSDEVVGDFCEAVKDGRASRFVIVAAGDCGELIWHSKLTAYEIVGMLLTCAVLAGAPKGEGE